MTTPNFEVEPGASLEKILDDHEGVLNEDSNHQMFSSLEEIKGENLLNINSQEIESLKISENENSSKASSSNEINTIGVVSKELSVSLPETTKLDDSSEIKENDDDANKTDEQEEREMKNWAMQKKHIFVLSSAGKPIYTRYGSEDKLAWLFGVMQTLVSFVQAGDDNIRSIHAGDTNIVFLSKKPLILVAVSKTDESTSHLVLQLNYVFNQITSLLTLTRLTKIYEQRQNYDLRRLLAGGERLIDHLLNFSDVDPSFTLGAVQCLPLNASVRDSISSAITGACSKIKNLVFAILIAKNKLITMVRLRKYCLHPADLHLIFNLVQASESLKQAESWTPLCLPKFDSSGFLYAHVSYLAEDCQACLLLLTVEKEVFFTLSDAKQKIVEKLRRGSSLEAINESMNLKEETAFSAGFHEVRHYLYKCKSTAQFYQPAIGLPYTNYQDQIFQLYKRSYQKLHNPIHPLKLIFDRSPNEAILSWDTKGFELYIVFEPLVETATAINLVSKLLNWIKRREDKIFHLNAPTF